MDTLHLLLNGGGELLVVVSESAGRDSANAIQICLSIGRLQKAALSGIDGQSPCAQLAKNDRKNLLQACKQYVLPVQGDRGYTYAEVTMGGVPLEEVDLKTMASRKTPGLSLVGEILDVDGRIGGFNFQWAWATGFIAGSSAVSIS